MHESGTFVRFTQAGADLFAQARFSRLTNGCALECGVGFRQLRTCRRTRPGQPRARGADIASAMGSKRPPEGGLSFRKESFPSDVNLDGKIGAYPIRLPSLQSLSLKFSESWIGTN